MELLESIINCEEIYLQLTSGMSDHGNYIYFKDEITPDIPMQNYTYIKRNTPYERLRELINLERDRLITENLQYVRLVFDPMIPYSAEVPDLSDFSFNCYNIFTLDLESLEGKEAHKNCYPAGEEDVEQLRQYYRALIDENEDYDPHIDRWLDIKMSEPNLETIVFEDNGVIVGSCELFICKELVKIEDLEVIKSHQNRGIGFALLSSAVSIAKSRNAQNLYLISEYQDDITSYYLKRGFKLYTEYNSCTLYR